MKMPHDEETPVRPRPCPAWFDHAIIYQIYPQSFYDADNDGTGDIPGIIDKLPYLESLGVNVLWLNPCFASPFRDAGYDISDFYSVAPRLGTNRDLKRLFRKAKSRGMRVLLDLVAAHTSIDHPWFKASCRHEPNRYSDWYIWTDSAWNRGGNGTTAISGFSGRNACYLPSFFYSQPALNYGFADPDPKQPWQKGVDHPSVLKVREELKKMIRYWLDAGASGFRVDMAGTYVKGNNPEKGNAATAELWHDIRTMLDKKYPDAVLVSEWFKPRISLKAGFHADFVPPIRFPADTYDNLIGRCTEFSNTYFHPEGKADIGKFMSFYHDLYKKTKRLGHISFLTGNHDNIRMAHGKDHETLKIVFTFVLTMPGPPVIYYGDEIGMRYLEGLPSKEGGYNRTGSRTPMQWDNSRNKGFSKSKAGRLYLPVDPSPDAPSAGQQDTDPSSLLNFVRELIRIKKSHHALAASGNFQPLSGPHAGKPCLYLRAASGETILVALNPSRIPARAELPSKWSGKKIGLLLESGVTLEKKEGALSISMAPSSYALFVCKERLSG